MITKQQLMDIVQEQAQLNQDLTYKPVARQALAKIEMHLSTPHAVIITGIRRCGKSTLAQQIKQKHFFNKAHQFTFEDERLINFTAQDFSKLHEVLIELYGDKKTFFLDEIQNIDKWELFVRRMMNQGYKFFITGSNASMLSQELGTRLTGRNVRLELFPFSFGEFLDFQKYDIEKIEQFTAKQKASISKLFKQYLLSGGMPEYLQYNNQELLARTYDEILYRDIVTRYSIKDVAAFRNLAIYLFNNYSAKVTYSSLKPILNIKNTSTISNYFYYLENSYLIFTLKQFSFSLKQQHLLPKKVYVIDSGMATVLNLQSNPNLGRLLENLVFIELKRRYKEIYYFESKLGYEVDFIIMDRGKPINLIQVSLDISSHTTYERELRSLTAAMKETKLKHGIIVTLDEKKDIKLDGLTIKVLPAYEWLLLSQ